MNPLLPYDQAAGLLPFGMRQLALAVPETNRMLAEEIRLRAGQPISITLPCGEMVLPGSPIVSRGDLHTVLEMATHSSAHTALEHVRRGFFTVRGGHRIGLCGTVAEKDGSIHSIRHFSSLNIRIARQIHEISNDLLFCIRSYDFLPSVLVLAPPGAGKTTLLRDLIRGYSYGVGGAPLRVGVADERGELGAIWDGVPQFDLGPHTDIMDGCPKAEGLMMLLRGMSPQVLAMDEITAAEDIDTLETAVGCGVALLASAHGRDIDDLSRRPLYSDLLRKKFIHIVIRIVCDQGNREYRMEAIPC